MLPVAIICLIIFCFFCPHRKKARGMTDARAINISGSLRMLNQCAMKNYLMIGAGIRPDAARDQLALTIELFDMRLGLMQKWATGRTLKYLIRRVELAWIPYRYSLQQLPERQRVRVLWRQSNDLMEISNELVDEIVRRSGKSAAATINVAGRQRMLSQQIAKNCVAMVWGFETSEVRDEFSQAVALFEDSMRTLNASPLTTPRIAVALERANSLWAQSKPKCQKYCSGPCKPVDVYASTETLLLKMDKITCMYQEIMDGGDGDIGEDFIHDMQASDKLESTPGSDSPKNHQNSRSACSSPANNDRPVIVYGYAVIVFLILIHWDWPSAFV